MSGACQGAPLPAAVLPDHAWRTTSASGGPTYTFRAGQQVELSRLGATLGGTYQMPTDSTLVLDVAGYLPGGGDGGPIRLTLRYNVRVLSAERVVFWSGTASDTLTRVD